MLTIDEIKEVSFRRGRGYRGEDVDAFIDEVIVTFEQMRKEKTDLIRKMDILAARVELMKKEKYDLIRKMDILATRVEQYRADEEIVRNALLSSQRVADDCVKEANAMTVNQKKVNLKKESDNKKPHKISFKKSDG